MQKLKGLPDFVTMTNYCESKGYQFDMVKQNNGFVCNLYKENKLYKKGSVVYDSCFYAQKEVYTKLYQALNVRETF